MSDGGVQLPPPAIDPPVSRPPLVPPLPPTSSGAQPPAPPPPPVAPPPPPGGPGSPTPGASSPWWKRYWWAIAIAIVAIVAVVAVLVTGGSDDADSTLSTVEATTTTVDDSPSTSTPSTESPTSTEAPETTGAPEETSVPTTEAPRVGEVDGAPAGIRGDRSSPVPAGSIADIGDGWRLQVLEVTEDATDAILAENDFNEPPPDGSRFTLVKVALGYYGLDDPQSSLFTTITGVASAASELGTECGLYPGALDVFVDLFAGGVQTGNLCFVTTPADSGQLQLYATGGFDSGESFLDASATPASVEDMTALTGPQAGAASTARRQAAIAVGTSTDVGNGWSLTVNGATDITDQVLADNEFNDPPPEGARFVGVSVEYTYAGDSPDTAYSVSVNAVGDGNVQLNESCGSFEGEVERFDDLFSGGSVAGLLCFVAPTSDVGTIALYADAEFTGNYQFFATG